MKLLPSLSQEAQQLGVSAEVDMHTCIPDEVIMDEANRHQAGLILIGKIGRKRHRSLLGSMTERIVRPRTSRCWWSAPDRLESGLWVAGSSSGPSCRTKLNHMPFNLSIPLPWRAFPCRMGAVRPDERFHRIAAGDVEDS